MNRKRQILRELFLNALTIALVKQMVVASVAAELDEGEASTAPESSPEGHEPIPPWYLG